MECGAIIPWKSGKATIFLFPAVFFLFSGRRPPGTAPGSTPDSRRDGENIDFCRRMLYHFSIMTRFTDSSFPLDDYIRKVPDFPKPGILFYDITGVLASPEAFRWCLARMEEAYAGETLDAVAAVESRGFVFAAPFALQRKIPLVLIRKKGKLPGKVYSCSYELEYGTAVLEVHQADVPAGGRILVVDDLIATGGTLNAAKNVLAQGGASVAGYFGVIGLPFLRYADVLDGVPVTTLIEYQGE